MLLRSGRDAVVQDETLDALFDAARDFDVNGVRRELETLLPEYSPANEES